MEYDCYWDWIGLDWIGIGIGIGLDLSPPLMPERRVEIATVIPMQSKPVM